MALGDITHEIGVLHIDLRSRMVVCETEINVETVSGQMRVKTVNIAMKMDDVKDLLKVEKDLRKWLGDYAVANVPELKKKP